MKRYLDADTIRLELPDILHDESRFECGIPSAVFFPESAQDLKDVLTEVRKQKQKVTFIGAQTGTTGGAVPEEGTVAISFSAMNKIRSIECTDSIERPILVCDPGVTLDSIDRFLKTTGNRPYNIPGGSNLTPGAYFYPPDPTEMTAQLGGTIATNASGARSYCFGPTRSHIAFLDLVFASGETARLRRSDEISGRWNRQITTDQDTTFSVPLLPYNFNELKNASGYYQTNTMQAIDLFIGSEGTLAAIAGIGIYLHPAPSILAGLSFFKSKETAFDFADFLRTEQHVAAIEFFDSGALHFIDTYRSRIPDTFPVFPENADSAILWEFLAEDGAGFEENADRWENALIQCGSSFDATWSGFDEAEKERLHHFRHALPETVNSIIAEKKRSCKAIRKIGTDSAFPGASFRASYNEMMRLIHDNSLTHAAFGHLGNYHIHVNLVPSNAEELSRALAVYDEMMALAIRENGTVSAEHGIGKIKKKYLKQMYGEEVIDAMRLVKLVFDPMEMLNPGNLF
jgi:D-lactate dehydrogenase (cytochrome)